MQTIGHGEPVVIPNGVYFVHDLAELADGFQLIAYDPRNRGFSERVMEGERIVGDIHSDVEDLELVRRHLGLERLNLIGHSYMGLVVALYAMTYPEHVRRVVQIGPAQPQAAKFYPADLKFDDGVMAQVFGRMGQMRGEATSTDPVSFCRKMVEVMRVMYVVDPANAHRIDWGRCEAPNELGFMKYWMENLMPSLQKLEITPEMYSKVTCPVLTIHGRKDRNAPYGGALDWFEALPNVQLVSIENAAHAPWVEAPAEVLGAIRNFLATEVAAAPAG